MKNIKIEQGDKMRHNNRENNQPRKIDFILDFTIHPEGSVLCSFGNTKVICNVTVDERIPSWLKGSNKGWITAEYSMLPRATEQRTIRESSKGKVTGRTMEIQRLIGRALRSVVDLTKLGERTVWIDCDVIQADGGTRTAAITGSFVALKLAMDKLLANKVISEDPIKEHLAAVSVGVVGEDIILDLDYVEDSSADVDMNVVMTESGQFVEIQGTGEEATFSYGQLTQMLDVAGQGITQIITLQKNVLNQGE